MTTFRLPPRCPTCGTERITTYDIENYTDGERTPENDRYRIDCEDGHVWTFDVHIGARQQPPPPLQSPARTAE